MKIGINASFLRKPDSGIGQVTLNFLRKLSELKDESDKLKEIEFVLYLEEDADLDLPEGFEKKFFLPSFYRRDDLVRKIIWEKFLLPRQAKKDECDIFLSLYQSATIFTKNKQGIRHIMLVHDVVWKVFSQYLSNRRKKTYYGFVDRAIRCADEIITISQFSKAGIEKYIFGKNNGTYCGAYQGKLPSTLPAKITVSHIDCDPVFKKDVSNEEMRKVSDKYKLNGNYIFYVGGFDVRKNVDWLIEAYGKLCQNLNDIETPNLVLAGKFHQHLVPLVTDVPAKIKEVSQKYGFDRNKIKPIGFVDQQDLPALYQGAKLFCYPSLYEGFGLPVLEAFNCSCPVVTSNSSSIKEMANSNNAILVDPESVDSIAEGMKKGLIDEGLRNNIVRQAKRDAGEYDWNKFVNNVLGAILRK